MHSNMHHRGLSLRWVMAARRIPELRICLATVMSCPKAAAIAPNHMRICLPLREFGRFLLLSAGKAKASSPSPGESD